MHQIYQSDLDHLIGRSLLTQTKDELCVDVNQTGHTMIYGCGRVVDLLPKHEPPQPCELEALRHFYSFLGVVSLLCLLATLYVYIKIKEDSFSTVDKVHCSLSV